MLWQAMAHLPQVVERPHTESGEPYVLIVVQNPHLPEPDVRWFRITERAVTRVVVDGGNPTE